MGAHRGREGNLVRTLIRPNGWCKVARNAERRQKTVDEGEKREKEKERKKGEREKKRTPILNRRVSGWTKRMRAPQERA
ncbi:hypothetical protein INR49_009209 [Caranx melampygus]|nr:hypothetical protein INR49_009209 [Caranx melampygus]